MYCENSLQYALIRKFNCANYVSDNGSHVRGDGAENVRAKNNQV
jgi:hypothetical protein